MTDTSQSTHAAALSDMMTDSAAWPTVAAEEAVAAVKARRTMIAGHPIIASGLEGALKAAARPDCRICGGTGQWRVWGHKQPDKSRPPVLKGCLCLG